PGEAIKTLDGETRKIDAETVVIADARRPIGLGGIMGGQETEITASTTNVLIECAWFDPSTIRRTARRLGLKTDASYRFERRMDPTAPPDCSCSLAARAAKATRPSCSAVWASARRPGKTAWWAPCRTDAAAPTKSRSRAREWR